MLFTPRNGLPRNKTKMGYARGKGPSGHWLRARASVVNTNTPPLSRWRHIFGTAKKNWAAILANTLAGNPNPIIGTDGAWNLLNDFYNGVLQPGPYENSVQGQGTGVPCASGEAYYQMVQANAANLNLPPLPTPVLTEVAIANPATLVDETYGSLTILTESTTSTAQAPLQAALPVIAEGTNTPTNTLTLTITGAPGGVNAIWYNTGTSTTTLTPGSSPANNDTLLVQISNTQAVGSIPLTLNFTANGTPETIPLTFTVAACGLAPNAPPPVFADPKSMGCSTEYDTSYNITGFLLTYEYVQAWTYPASPWQWDGTGYSAASGANAPGLWAIYASDVYTESYAPPAASTWVPILFSGPNIPLPAEVLAAWETAYGALPDTGNIKFQACYIDPVSCASGPALSCTAGWKLGTLLGQDIAAFTGPKFTATNPNPGTFDGSVSGVTISMDIQGANGYSGNITFSSKNTYYLPTGTPPGTKTLPTGTTITFTPASLTIAPGDTTIHLVTAVFTLPADSPNYELHLKLEATDSIQTSSSSNIIQITDGAGTLLPFNYLSISPSTSNPAPPSPGQAVVVITLYNTDANEISGVLLAAATNNTIGIEFATLAPSAATATDTTITFALPNSQGTNGLIGQTLSSTGYAPAGYNVTDAAIISSDDSTATIPTATNPGAMTTEGQTGLVSAAFTVPGGTLEDPGTATSSLIITVPGSIDTLGIQIAVEAYAGTNSTTYTLTLGSP
jgi:hypothetical protein